MGLLGGKRQLFPPFFIFLLKIKTMKLLLQIFTLLLSVNTFAQSFKPAEITLENNSKISGLVFYNTPYHTPQSFRFKASETSEEKIYNKNDIKNISVNNYGEFLKTDVEISRHNEAQNKISYNGKFNLQKENLILEVLVKGTNTLYKFADEKNTAFFYSANDGVIKPLLYKEYYHPDNESAIVKNNEFRIDLKNLACENASVNYVKYSDSELIKFFKKANECAGDTNQTIKKDFTKNYLKVVTTKNFGKEKYDVYDVKSSYTFGLEFERNMPFVNNSFSIAFATNYTTFDRDEEKTEIHYANLTNQVEVALILRYYPLNTEKYKVFVGVYAFDWSMSHYVTRTFYSGNPIVKENVSQLLTVNNIEAGFRYKDFEIFGLLNISQNYLQRNQASIGLKYNLPFVK